jgi:SNF2 family DNA or RNA helicase
MEKFTAYKALQKSHPPLPIGLKASLRSYQKEGFEWMMRSLEWGAGVCLADDMGLGKTIQTLAVLLARAPQGPSMVVAPTSVMFNWEKEAKEFTPDLQIHIFGGAEREKILESLQPFDLVICSYSILQNLENAEKLARVQWNIVLLDEAQMVKNSSSKRAESVYSLRSQHKILTTGTPIENHLGELWSLFHFLNPTLFGTQTMFKRKFSDPIQKYGDKKASERLQKLVSPFILRRLKKDVLHELPGKTEITLHVELNTQEREFYNSLRSKALLKLSEEDLPESQKRIQVLLGSKVIFLRRRKNI